MTFENLTAKQRAAIKAQPQRALPSYWSASELALLLYGANERKNIIAVEMQVLRKKLNPANRVPGKRMAYYLFSDEEVARYLSRPRKTGRPKGSGKKCVESLRLRTKNRDNRFTETA